MLLLADGVLLARLRICLDLGVAGALRELGLVALGAGLAGPDDGADAGVRHLDALGVAAEAVLRGLSAIQLVDHIFGIGGCHSHDLAGHVVTASKRSLLAHLDVGLGTHGLDVGRGLHLGEGLRRDPLPVLLDDISGSSHGIAVGWLKLLEVVQE